MIYEEYLDEMLSKQKGSSITKADFTAKDLNRITTNRLADEQDKAFKDLISRIKYRASAGYYYVQFEPCDVPFGTDLDVWAEALRKKGFKVKLDRYFFIGKPYAITVSWR